MSISLVINGNTYFYPETGDEGWGTDATSWAVAVTAGMLQKAGGLFQLLADADFGTTYGIKSVYFKSRTLDIADAGQLRLAVTDSIQWRNNANAGNLSLAVNASNQLTYNGVAIQQAAITVTDTATIDLTLTGSDISGIVIDDSLTNAKINSAAAIAYSKLNLVGNILNADISASAAIAYSKLSLSNSILNVDINASAAIAYSKLNLSSSIVNADVNGSAAIAYSKLALANSILNADINASAAIVYSKLSLTNSILNADINSAAAIAYTKLNLTGTIVNADISASAAIAFSKLATLSSANILVGSAGNVATSVAVTGDVTLSNAGVTAIGANKVVNSMLAQMAQSTIKGRAASSGTGDPVDLSATQATAILNNFIGDSGSGGTKGLVPAPASGDAAAGKVLRADGVWAVPAGGGNVTGPASSASGTIARFADTSGTLLSNTPSTISNSDVNASAAIAYSKLSLSASVVNADIASAAAIAVNKLAALTVSRAVVSDGSGFLAVATTTATEIGYVNGVTSAIQTQLNTKAAALDPITSTSSNISLTTADKVVLVSTSGGTVDLTLPAASTSVGWAVTITKADAANNLNINRAGADTINGKTTIKMVSQYETIRIECVTTSTFIVYGVNPGTQSEVRVYTGNGYGSTNTVIRRFVTTQTNTGQAITYADSATLGASFTVNQNAIYGVDYTDVSSGASVLEYGVSLNSSQLTTQIRAITTADRIAFGKPGAVSQWGTLSVSGIYIASGGIIRAHTDANSADTAGYSAFRVIQLQKVY